jgi:hypothetical protein
MLQTWYEKFITLFILFLGNLKEFTLVKVDYISEVLFDHEIGVEHHATLHYQ